MFYQKENLLLFSPKIKKTFEIEIKKKKTINFENNI